MYRTRFDGAPIKSSVRGRDVVTTCDNWQVALTRPDETSTRGERRFPPSRWLFVIGAVALVGVLLLGAKVESLHGPLRSDIAVAGRLRRDSNGAAVREIAAIGSELPVLASVVALVAWAASRRDWRAAAVALIGPPTALFLTEYVLKPLIDRESATGAWLYPSGHATIVAALATTAVLFVYRYIGQRPALLWSPVAIVVIGAVSLAVVVLRWHYVTDSVGGVCLGIGVVFLVAGGADSIKSTTTRRTTRGAGWRPAGSDRS